MKTKTMFAVNLISAVLMVANVHSISTEKAYPLAVHFDFAKSDLKLEKTAKTDFARVAQEMKNYPYAKLEIDGHTDFIGPRAFNQRLSEERAAAVRSFLTEHYGISSDRIVVRAFGKTRPETTNATSSGRAENRRAVALIYRLEPAAAGTDRPAL